jgi:hypothetical protein
VFAVGISAREFARRDGCSDTLVRRAGKNGKLRVSATGEYDEKQVGTDWRPRDREVRTEGANTPVKASANTKHVRTPPKAANRRAPAQTDDDELPLTGTPLQRAILLKEQATGKLKDLEFRVKSGDLISAEVAAGVLFEEFRAARDNWLNWPSSVAPHMAADLGVDIDKLVEVLTRYVHDHLSELGEPDGDFGQGSGAAAPGGASRMDAPTTH